ncbi:hypothetical protein K491DRAFT_721180 [Lophiostoma macrostomum CBS 122681]|uniref:NACHT domain-containing protein n=1 Tax=Lophiostoma macrostomum CBS 122681 TaxID=1314788 RepID=A0A6A6SR34_9PLEO|nr:hypothetical protein K491DRAFT_721180 [Lophiostoma macrostomum CBS 122681]
MAEAFGIVSGALTVVEASTKVISKCKHLIETVQDAPKDLQHVLIEISTLQATLNSLHYISATHPDFSCVCIHMVEVNGAVEGCRSIVEELARELDGLSILGESPKVVSKANRTTGTAEDHPPSEPSQTTGAKRRQVTSATDEFALSEPSQIRHSKRKRVKGTLEWCYKQSKVDKLLDQAMKHKITICTALLGEVAVDIKDIQRGVKHIGDDVGGLKSRAICDWLEEHNPSNDHNLATRLRIGDTCQWMLQQQEWLDWVANSIRSIWIQGIPGAGKTVLISFLVEQVTAVCYSSPGSSICLYYYCSYRAVGDQTTSFMRWIVSQLCREAEHIPKCLMLLYRRNTQPTVDILKNVLEDILAQYDNLYIFLDAIDECDTRSDLLRL